MWRDLPEVWTFTRSDLRVFRSLHITHDDIHTLLKKADNKWKTIMGVPKINQGILLSTQTAKVIVRIDGER